MRTVDLRTESLTLHEILRLAQTDSLLILTHNGNSYTLQETESFEDEVARFGKSERFMEFLKERGKEPGTVSLEDVENRLSATDSED